MFSREAADRAIAAPGGPASPLAGSPVERLRPRTAPQLLDAGFEVLRFRARTIAILLAVLHGPFFLASLWMLQRANDDWFAASTLQRWWDGGTLPSTFTADLAWSAGSVLCTWFGEMLFAVGLATLVRGWLEGTDPSPRSVLAATTRRLPTTVAAWTVALVLKTTGAAICLVGLLLFVPHLSILAPVLAFERCGVMRAISRSRDLVNRASERALFLVLIAPVLSIALPWVVQLGARQGFAEVEEFATVMGLVVTLALVVARTSTMVLFYLDIRVRTEGLDLALRAPRILGASA